MKNNIFKSLFFLIIGFISGILFLVVFFIILIFSISFNIQSSVLSNNSWLILDFSGNIIEKPVSQPFLYSSSSKREIQLIDYLYAIERAAYDNRISGIIINGDVTYYSKVHTEEINNSLVKYKKSGKDIFAWFSQADITNYLMCITADKIYMPDTDSSNLTISGYTQTIPYLKKTFDNIGLDFNVIHIGNYKGTGENYTRDTISPGLKESYNSMIESLNEVNIDQISKNRNISITDLNSIIKSGKTILMSSDVALNYGFVDGKLNYEELKKSLSKNDDFKSISINEYVDLPVKKVSANKIAIIYAEGMITNYYSSENSLYGDIVGAKSFINDLNEVKNDKKVKAVIIRVNSPGGSALGSELILQTIEELKKSKPVYMSFGPVAASGGYYISCNSDRIFTSPSTLTGSIGVVSILMNHAELNKKLGINFEVIKKNNYDDFLSQFRKPYSEEIEILRNSMLLTYNEFTSHLMNNRSISNQEIPLLAEGRVWTGIQSLNNRLSDQIGGLIDTIDYAVITNKLDNFTIDSYPKPASIISKFFNLFNVQYNIELYDKKNLKNLIQLSTFYKENGYKPAYLMPFIDIP